MHVTDLASGFINEDIISQSPQKGVHLSATAH